MLWQKSRRPIIRLVVLTSAFLVQIGCNRDEAITGHATTLSPASTITEMPASTQIPPTPTPTHIRHNDTWGIYLMDISDENLTRLTEPGASYRFPQFSPDGAYLAFIRSGPAGALILYDRRTEQMHVAVEGFHAYWSRPLMEPAWSPDSRYLAFIDDPGIYPRICVYEVNTGTRRTLLDWNGISVSALSWSPDGEHLAFAGEGENGSEIYVLDIGDAELRQLTTSGGLAAAPSWSPDGEAMAYVALYQGMDSLAGDLHLMEPVHPESVPIELSNWTVTRPIWSPDGQWVTSGGMTSVVIINRLTQEGESVIGGAATFIPRGWSYDGSILLFESMNCCLHCIDTARLEDENVNTVIGCAPGDVIFWQIEANWAPDDNLIAFSGLWDPLVP